MEVSFRYATSRLITSPMKCSCERSVMVYATISESQDLKWLILKGEK